MKEYFVFKSTLSVHDMRLLPVQYYSHFHEEVRSRYRNNDFKRLAYHKFSFENVTGVMFNYGCTLADTS